MSISVFISAKVTEVLLLTAFPPLFVLVTGFIILAFDPSYFKYMKLLTELGASLNIVVTVLLEKVPKLVITPVPELTAELFTVALDIVMEGVDVFIAVIIVLSDIKPLESNGLLPVE